MATLGEDCGVNDFPRQMIPHLVVWKKVREAVQRLYPNQANLSINSNRNGFRSQQGKK